MHTVSEHERMLLWLSYGTEHYVRQWKRMLARYPSLAEACALLRAGKRAEFAFLSERCVARLCRAAEPGFLDAYIEQLERDGIDFVAFGSDAYPALLKEIHDAPGVLYFKGRLEPSPRLPVAVIGSRRATDYGLSVARLFSHAFASAGVTVVSGMAAGIDTAAARGALDCAEAAYPTVAVLGTGVDLVYPAENRKLYQEIIERGAVVSEFLPGTEGKPQNFPIRNRIMSGLSRGVVVVEAGERSGTSITAGYAHDEGREVFAVPGRITDVRSVGANRMIRFGEAKPVFCVEDVLEEFDAVLSPPGGNPYEVSFDPLALSEGERAVYERLLTGEKTIDELCEGLPYSTGQINSFLTALQFSGIMKQLPGRVYALSENARPAKTL